MDATLVTAHSEKQLAAATFKKGFGFHPIGAWADHGPGGTGEPLSMLLRPGNAGSNTAADHISVVKAALAQLLCTTADRRPGRSVLVRTDGAGGTHEFVDWLTRQRVQYSVGFTLTTDTTTKVDALPDQAWTPAYDGDGKPRDGAWVAELTGVLKLTGWPTGMRVIVRAERPHPGAQLKFTDSNGNRLTAFATNTKGGQLADLELRHRRRARCEDRAVVAAVRSRYLADPGVPRAAWSLIRDYLPAYDPAVTPTRTMGAVAELFRTVPGAVRSAHPHRSFAAVGPHAAQISGTRLGFAQWRAVAAQGDVRPGWVDTAARGGAR